MLHGRRAATNHPSPAPRRDRTYGAGPASNTSNGRKHIANKGDKVVFRSLNDGKDHDGTVLKVADSPSARAQFGDAVLRVQASDTKRDWELVSGSDVRSN